MRNVTGCYVCPKPDLGRDHHTHQEILEAVEKLKEEKQTALLTEAYVEYIVDKCNAKSAEEGDHEQGDGEEYWAQEDEDSDNDFAFISREQISDVGILLRNKAFIHGRNVKTTKGDAIIELHAQLTGEDQTFVGIQIDTCANKL